jgi:hypothetical protein
MTGFCTNFFISSNSINILNTFPNSGQNWYWNDYAELKAVVFTTGKVLNKAIQKYIIHKTVQSVIGCSTMHITYQTALVYNMKIFGQLEFLISKVATVDLTIGIEFKLMQLHIYR